MLSEMLNGLIIGGALLSLGHFAQKEFAKPGKQAFADKIGTELAWVRDCLESVKFVNQTKTEQHFEKNPFRGSCNLSYHRIKLSFLLNGISDTKAVDDCFADTHTIRLWGLANDLSIDDFNKKVNKTWQACEDNIIAKVNQK